MSIKQEAEISSGGSCIQVAGDFHQGLSFENVERLMQLLLAENFPKLQAEASAKAKQNVEELIQKTFDKLNKKIELISLQKLSEPDVQSTFNDAVQGAAKKGNTASIDLLSDLLELRAESSNSSFLDICIEQAVLIVPKLTQEMLCALATIQFVKHLEIKDSYVLDRMYEVVYREYASKCGNITTGKLMATASFGAGSYIDIMGLGTFNEFKKKYPELNTEGARDRFPFTAQTLGIYDEKTMYKLSLNPPGKIIALTLLQKKFPSFELKNLIE